MKLSFFQNLIYVWQADLSIPPLDITLLQTILTSDEKSQAQKFYFAKDARRFTIRRGLLRWLLGQCQGQDPRTLVFKQNEFGKPALAAPTEPAVRFNLSNSGEHAVFAVSGQEVGIDIEYLRPFEHADRIVNEFFSEQEKKEYNTLLPEQKQEAFFYYWTQKEAFVKAKGEGLSCPLAGFSTRTLPEAGDEKIPVQEGRGISPWYLQKINSADMTVAMVAAKGRDWQIRYCDWLQSIT